MVIRELAIKLAEKISNSDNPMFEAELIVMSVLKLSRTEYVLKSNEPIDFEAEELAFKMAEERASGKPLAYIIGNAEFMGLEFSLNCDTLIPRADTETLVELVIEYIGDKSIKVLDIGTGSGCIGISIAKFCKNAEVTLLDINSNALDKAKENALSNGVNVKTIQCDILNDIPDGEFDVIVSNPPYIRRDVIKTLQTEVKDFEPLRALDGGEDGLVFYRRIVDIADGILKKNGLLAFEIGYDQGREVLGLLTEFKNSRVVKDLAGNDRVVYGEKM